MSFRSRTTQPMVPRRRSLSSSRTTSANSIPSSYYNGNSGYSSRPLSTGYYPGGQTSTYQSPYANIYGSRDNLYNHSSRNGYYPNGAYDRYSKNSYGSDRYVSPYSSFDKGITTAGLSLSLPGKGYQPKSSTYSNNPRNSKKNDYTPGRSTNLMKTKSLSTSNTNLNSYPTPSTKISVGTNTPTSLVTRSQSLRDQERKSRSRSRNRNVAARSLSASSEKSEGYESGNEKASRSSRVGSTTSLNDNDQAEKTENGEVLDYKALWEAAKLENDKLKKELKKKDDELTNAKAAVDRFTNATTKNSLSELEKRERRAMERKLSEMEEELKHLDILKTENQRLKEENGALIRVISKLSK